MNKFEQIEALIKELREEGRDNANVLLNLSAAVSKLRMAEFYLNNPGEEACSRD